MAGKSSQEHDVYLIKQVKDGDRTAFRQLVEKHKDVSISLACSILKDESKAEDVLQEVFIKVFKAIDSYKFKSTFSTWLYRIVVNTSYNELKKRKVAIDIDDIGNDITTDFNAIDVINELDQRKYILLAIKHLRPDEALVLRLFYLCELSIKEIQEITDFKPAKIKVDLHRGRGNLYFYLKQILGDEINHLI